MNPSDNISAIEAVEKAIDGATSGPWSFWVDTNEGGREYAATVLGPNIGNGGYPVVADIPPRTMHGTHSANAAYIAACNPVAMSAILAEARKANDELAVARSVHRWNVDRYGENLAVCRNEHEKGEPCGWETFVPLARAEGAEARVAELETALDRAPDGRHFDILAEALAEVKATSDGKSDQSIADIVAGCLDEIAALPPRRARTLLNGGSDAQG